MAAYTETDLAAIRATIAKGELRVDFADRSVTYRSMDELLRAEALIAQSVAEQAGTTRPKQYLAYAAKGF